MAWNDQAVYLHDVSWEQYEQLLAMRGEKANPRISYLEGEVELMSPSHPHESWSFKIARLLTVWADSLGVRLYGYGQWTLKRKRQKRGLEPDQCFIVGRHKPSVPDLAVEVEWSSGGIDKLDIYRKLGVREVWWWKRGEIKVYELRSGKYVRREGSKVLPGFDFATFVRYLKMEDQVDAVRAYRRALRRH